MTDAITSTGQAAADTATVGRTRLAENFDTFLTLLTTQLKNQDPLSPMDSTQFTQQLVQMTSVEQQLYTNDLLKSLVTNTASGVDTAVGLIGKDVRVASDDAALSGGKADWVYKLDDGAANVRVEVLDSQGRSVHVENLKDVKAGDQAFSWNGKGDDGAKYTDGTFTLKVTATAADGTPIKSTNYVQGVVTSVEQADGRTLLGINGGKVPWDKITTIAQAKTTPVVPTPTASNTDTPTTPSDDEQSSSTGA